VKSLVSGVKALKVGVGEGVGGVRSSTWGLVGVVAKGVAESGEETEGIGLSLGVREEREGIGSDW